MYSTVKYIGQLVQKGKYFLIRGFMTKFKGGLNNVLLQVRSLGIVINWVYFKSFL